MKALEKERSRRYETANGLARDIERYLHDDPVEARPPSAGYRFGKFARRNKAALLTAGLVAAALVVGTIVSTWQAIRATRAERLAQAKQAEADANYQKAKAAVEKYFTLVSESTLFDAGLSRAQRPPGSGGRVLRRVVLERTDDRSCWRNGDLPRVSQVDIAMNRPMAASQRKRWTSSKDCAANIQAGAITSSSWPDSGKGCAGRDPALMHRAISREHSRSAFGWRRFGNNWPPNIPRKPGSRLTWCGFRI
jgi:hypothetical protein